MDADIHLLAGITASLIAILAVVPYVISILRNATKPSTTTWIIWTFVSILLAASYQASGATYSFLITVSYVISSAIVAVLSLRYGAAGVTLLDLLCLGGAFLSVIPWLFFHSAPATLYLIVFIDGLGAIPTIRKAYLEPESENRSAWLIAFAGNALNLGAIGSWSLEVGVFPLYAFLSTGLITAILFLRTGVRDPRLISSNAFELEAELLPALLAGIKSRLARLSSARVDQRQHLGLIHEFYKRNRHVPKNERIFDASTGLYKVIASEVAANLEGIGTIIDLGCGSATLSRQECTADKTYIGIDLYISAKSTNDRTHFIESTINPTIDITRLRNGVALFLLINLLCYVQNTADLELFLRRNTQVGDLLLLVEPTRSLFWETYFYGIRLQLRSRKQVTSFLAAAGFELEREYPLVVPVWRRIGRAQISRMLVSRKAKSMIRH